jgi:hypothetical protein
MKRYEKHLLIGTILTFIGIFIIYKIRLILILGWSVLLFGKVLIILSVAEYVDYKRVFRGEDLSQDPKYKKMLRQIRKKYY